VRFAFDAADFARPAFFAAGFDFFLRFGMGSPEV
jgi:hypothetical protein